MQFTHLNLEVSNLKFLQKNLDQSRHFSQSIAVHASLFGHFSKVWAICRFVCKLQMVGVTCLGCIDHSEFEILQIRYFLILKCVTPE